MVVPLLVVGALGLALQVVHPALYLATTAGDFGNYYRAGEALLQGASPFSIAKFDYPPLLAFLVAPLAPLPLETARWIWFVLGELCLVAAAWLCWDWLGRDRVALAAVLTVWCLAGTAAENLVLGQINPLLLLMTVGALRTWERRPGLAGLLIGCATALKLWPGVMAAGFLLHRRWRAVAVSVATATVLLLGPWLWIRVALPEPHRPITAGYWRGTPAPLNFGLPGLALRLAEPPRGPGPMPETWLRGHDPEALRLSPGDAALSITVALATLVAGLVILARADRSRSLAARRADGGDEGLVPAALLSLALLAATLSWYHYQLLQLPALAWLGARWWRRRVSGTTAARLLPVIGLALLGTGLTRGQYLFGLYVGAYGWTGQAPVALWLATGLVPVLNSLTFGLLVREVDR